MIIISTFIKHRSIGHQFWMKRGSVFFEIKTMASCLAVRDNDSVSSKHCLIQLQNTCPKIQKEMPIEPSCKSADAWRFLLSHFHWSCRNYSQCFSPVFYNRIVTSQQKNMTVHLKNRLFFSEKIEDPKCSCWRSMDVNKRRITRESAHRSPVIQHCVSACVSPGRKTNCMSFIRTPFTTTFNRRAPTGPQQQALLVKHYLAPPGWIHSPLFLSLSFQPAWQKSGLCKFWNPEIGLCKFWSPENGLYLCWNPEIGH